MTAICEFQYAQSSSCQEVVRETKNGNLEAVNRQLEAGVCAKLHRRHCRPQPRAFPTGVLKPASLCA